MLTRQTVLHMRVWWDSRHPLPQTNTTEHSGNCWLSASWGRNHAAVQNHHLPTRRCLFAPANPNTYSHTCWQRYYHLKITVLFTLLFTPFVKATPASLCLDFCTVTVRDRRTWSSSESNPASWLICTNCPHIGCCCYCCCCCTERRKKQAQSYSTETQMKSSQLTLWSSFSVEPWENRAELHSKLYRPGDVKSLISCKPA